MDERFVVAVFVARAELKMAVEEEANVVFEARENEVLVARVAGEDDFVSVDVVFGGGGDFFRFGEADVEADENEQAGGADGARGGELVREDEGGPEGDGDVDQAEEHGGADEAEAGDEKDRED